MSGENIGTATVYADSEETMFERIVTAVKALNLKWTEIEGGRLICERGDCAIGALMRASGHIINPISSHNPSREVAYRRGGLNVPQSVIMRVMNANDGVRGVYAGNVEPSQVERDHEYLATTLGAKRVDREPDSVL